MFFFWCHDSHSRSVFPRRVKTRRAYNHYWLAVEAGVFSSRGVIPWHLLQIWTGSQRYKCFTCWNPNPDIYHLCESPSTARSLLPSPKTHPESMSSSCLFSHPQEVDREFLSILIRRREGRRRTPKDADTQTMHARRTWKGALISLETLSL